MDLVPPGSGSVYIYYDNMCCPQTLWLSYQCKEQLDVEEQANVLIIHILGLDIKGPLHFGSLRFHYWLVYTLNQKGKDISFYVSIVIT